MLQLQQLHGPLDVAQPTRPELEILGRGAAAGPLALHASLELADRGDLGGIDAVGGVSAEGDALQQPIDQLAIARPEARAQQSLRLPGVAPAPVVAQIAAEPADHRAVASVRAKIGVDDQRGFGTGTPQQRPHPGDDFLGPGQVVGLALVTDDEHRITVG